VKYQLCFVISCQPVAQQYKSKTTINVAATKILDDMKGSHQVPPPNQSIAIHSKEGVGADHEVNSP